MPTKSCATFAFRLPGAATVPIVMDCHKVDGGEGAQGWPSIGAPPSSLSPEERTRLRRERARQGLPEAVVDVGVLARVAAVLRGQR